MNLYDQNDRKLGEARVTDRSIGGVCLATLTRLPVGSRLGVAPFGLHDASTRLSLEIRNALVVAGEWRLGCAFLRCPSWSTLMHLR
ncbi:MAG: hypothetical protein K1X57_02880 [Gemmataceae bacterium]|nr:hypothetical protein [Gemmataceae bacterium]